MRSKIFELSLTHFAEGCLKGFDWWWDWVQIAILLADTPDKQERVMNELNSIIHIDGDDWDVKYNRETAQRYKLELISRCGTRDEQYKFMCENVGNPDFRRHLHRNETVVEGDLRNGLVVKKLTVEVRIGSFLK